MKVPWVSITKTATHSASVTTPRVECRLATSLSSPSRSARPIPVAGSRIATATDEQGPEPVDAGSDRQDEAQGADHEGASSKRFACRRNSSAYRPSAVIRSSCVPSSMTWP